MLAIAASLCALVLDPMRLPTTSHAAAPLSPVLRMVTEYDQSTYDPEKGGLSTITEGRPEGSHGTGYRFMPLSTMSKDASPALLCIAGLFPGLTADDLQRPQPLPFAPAGKWNYHVLTGDACSTGFVALPGSSLLDSHPDTVAVVCSGSSLGLEFPDGSVHEVLALIDRGDAATVDPSCFDNQAFYAMSDESNVVHIRWIDQVPAGWRILGRLLYTQMPLVVKPGGNSGFGECSDEFEF